MTDVQAHLETLAQQPADPASLTAVEALFSNEGRWEELLRVYEDNAQRAGKERAAPLLRKAAMVCLNELASGPRAESYLKRALDAQPTDVETLKALRELYLARGDYEDAARIWEKEASRLSDAKAKAEALVQVAVIYRDKLGRADKALTVLRQAQRHDANNPRAWGLAAAAFEDQERLDQAHRALMKELEVGEVGPDLLGRIGRLAQRMLERPKLHELAVAAADAVLEHAAGDELAQGVKAEVQLLQSDWKGRVADLEKQASVAQANQPEQAANLWLNVAELQLVYGEQSEMALVSLDRALAAVAGHAGALRLMEEIYGGQERWNELAMKLEMMAAYTRQADVAVELYLKAAMHQAVRLDSPDAAARLYARVLELVPGNKVASNALAEYYRERQQWDYALQVLSVWADRATHVSDKVAAHYACCRIYDEELNDKTRARPHYEIILQLDPENQAAARALEDAYREGGDHPALAKVLHAKLAGLKGDARNPVLQELGELCAGPLEQPAQALTYLGELYQSQPTAALREQLEELAARAGDFSSLVTFIENGLSKLEGDTERVAALHSLASLYEGAREAPLEALRIHRRILALSPGDERSKEAVTRLMEVAAESGDKVAVFREQADAASSNEEKVDILHRLGAELTTSTRDYVRAIDVYQEILQLSPADTGALDALLNLYRRDNRWAEVADLQRRRLESGAAGDQEVAVRLELAQIHEQQLGEVEPAVEHYLAVVSAQPGQPDAVSGLERLLTRSRRVLQIAETLQPIYEAASAWESAADMAEIRVRDEAEPTRRYDVLLQLAQLYERELSRPADGLAAYLRAFQANPGDSSLRREMERVAEVVGSYASVARAYRAAARGRPEAASAEEGAAQRELLVRAGQLSEKEGELDAAIIDYLRVIDGSEDGRQQGIEGLRRLLAAGVDKSKLPLAAENVMATLTDDAKTELLRALAVFYEADMGSTNEAAGAWKGVLEGNPGDAEAMAELDRLMNEAADPSELVSHLRTKLEAAPDDNTRANIGLQLADVLVAKLNDTAGAIAELNRVAEWVPGQRVVWQRLADLHQQAGQPTERAQAMHRELNLLTEGEERHDALVKYAAVLGQDLADVSNAVAALQSLFASAPSHAGGIQLLEQFSVSTEDPALKEVIAGMLHGAYSAANRWPDVIALLEQRAQEVTDPEPRVQILRELANLRAEKLEDAKGAYADLERAFREQPLDQSLRAELERLAEASGSLNELAEAYQSALSVIPDADAQRPIRRKLAQVLDKLGRGDEAVEHYKAAAGGELPDDLASLEAMERLLREQNNMMDLVEVLSAMVRHIEDAARKKAVQAELAQLLETQTGDKGRALETYKQLLEEDAKNADAARNVVRLLDELGQTQELETYLEKLVALGPQNPNLLDDYIRLAQAQISQGKIQEALASYKAVLLKRREHEGAIGGLEALIDQVENKLEVAQVLEPIYTAKQNHEKLAWVLEKRLDSTEEKVQRKGLLRRIGDIYENRLGQKAQAFAMARRSLAEDPSDMGVRMWIEKLAGETGSMRELADAYVEEATKAEAPLNLQFHRRAAAIFQEKLNDAAAAVGQYRAILELEERDEKSLTGLEAIFRQTEDHHGLVEILNRRLFQTAGVERKREYLTEIAKIQAEKIGDLAAAVETNRQILAITPDDPAPFAQIEQLLAHSGQWEELIQTYQAEEERLAEKKGRDIVLRRLEYTHRRARVVDQQFGDRAGAGAILKQLLEEEDMHTGTVEYLAARAAEGVLEFVEILEEVYRRNQLWQKYVELLQTKLGFIPETEVRRDIYLAQANAFDEHLQAGDMAFGAVTRAFNENRADVSLLDRLEELAEKYGYWEELVQVLGVDLDAIPDQQLRRTLLLKLGDICGIRIGNYERAVGYLNALLQYEPNDTEALEKLDAILEKNQMWAALADILERRVGVAAETSEKSKLLERLAEVWNERLMDPEAALRCHQQIMEIDPDHPISLLQMQKLYAEVQNWDALAKNLARQASVFDDPAEQVRIHAAAGELYAEEFGDMAAAIDHWQKVVELEPTHEAANNALDVLLATEDRWEELATHLQRRLVHTQDARAKLDINQRLGVILTERLGRGEDAVGTWQQVLEQDPKNLDAMRALLGLYTERAMWTEFVEIARRMIPLAEPAEAKQVRFHMAKALGENLGETEEAVKLAKEVRQQEPHTTQEMVELGEMLTNIQAYSEAVICLEKAGALSEEAAEKVQLYYRAAHMHREQLGEPNEAREAYEAILEVQPEDTEAFTALAEIYRNTEEWRRLVGLNEDFVPHADDQLRLQILTEIRDVQDQRLGEKELAFIAACRVYKEAPTDLNAAEVLERIALETDGAEEAAAVVEDEIDTITDPAIQIALYKRVARLYAEELADTASAEEILQKILILDAGDLEALDRMAELGAKEERYDKQIAALENKLQHVAEDTERKGILFEIARIWEDRIGELDEAVDALNRILAIDGGDVPALDALARIYGAEQRWSELAHVLTRKVELSHDPAENIELRMRVAQICEGELGDPEAGIQWYRGVLEFDPGHAGALAALDRLYTSLERWSELIQVFELQLAQAQTADEQLSLLSKEASIYESEFQSPRDAANCYERCFAVDQSHLPTVRNLERLLRVLGEWNRLIEILGHHITLIQDVEEITGLYLQIGEIYYKELARVDKAEQIYNMAREVNPNSDAALHALGQLYERSGNWFQGLEMMQREADAMGMSEEALPVLMRIGRINEDMLGDMSAARAAYQRALEIDPTYPPALQAMKEIAKSSEDWEQYIEHLLTEAETADDDEEKTELFVEAAEFFINVREDEMSAIRYYTRALEITPEHLDTCKALAEIYFRNEMWEEAGEMYEVVVRSLDKSANAKEFCQKHYRLGYIREKLGEQESALQHYRLAFEADATYLPALEGLGQALLGQEQWDEAQKVFQTILIHHRDSLTESEVVDVQAQLGDILLRQDQPDRAYHQFEKALEIDPDHAPSLSQLAKLDQQMQRWESAYVRLSRLGEVAPGPERVEALLRMSEIAVNNIGDVGEAIEPLERARKYKQASAEVLERLAELYLQVKQVHKAVEVFEEAAAMAEEPKLVSKLNFRLAQVYESAIKHEPLAVQKYNASLDADPTNTKAFEAIERILGARQEWALLENNYRMMIARAKVLTPRARLVLWRALAELYRQVLKNTDSAIAAYEVISKLDPDNANDKVNLAELYGLKPEKRAVAIEMQHDILAKLENPVPAIKALRKLYHYNQDFDAVYCLVATLAFLNSMDAEEKQVLEYLARGIPPRAASSLREEHWRLVKHPSVDNSTIGRVSTELFKLGRDIFLRPAKDLGLRKKDQIEVRGSELLFVTLVNYAGKVLNLQGLELFAKAGSMESIYLAAAQPPALVVGQNHELFRNPAQTRLTLFHLGRSIGYARPELFLARAFPGEGFRDLLFGLCAVYNRGLEHTGHPATVDTWAQHFMRLPQQGLRRLQPMVQQLYQDLIAVRPLEAYTAAVEHTVNRAGLIVSGDLAAAHHGITEGDEGASAILPRERIKELVLFSVSREYFEIRKAIGAALVAQQQQATSG